VRDPVAALRHVAGARRRAAYRRALLVEGAVGMEAVAELGHVAGPRRLPTERPGVPRRVLAGGGQPVTDVLRAHVAVVGARRPVRLLAIAGAGGTRARARLGRVALARRRPADGARGLEGVAGTRVARPVAGLGHVADTRRGPALGPLGTLRIGRAGRAGARTGLHRVAEPRRGAADCAGVARRVLAGDVGAVALIGRAGVAVVGAGGVARLHRIGWAGGSAPRAGLGHVAVAGRRAAH